MTIRDILGIHATLHASELPLWRFRIYEPFAALRRLLGAVCSSRALRAADNDLRNLDHRTLRDIGFEPGEIDAVLTAHRSFERSPEIAYKIEHLRWWR